LSSVHDQCLLFAASLTERVSKAGERGASTDGLCFTEQEVAFLFFTFSAVPTFVSICV